LRVGDHRIAAGLPYFDGLKESSVRQLLDGSQLQRFPVHADIIDQGQCPEFLHVLVEGRVEVFTSYRDRETTVDILGEGDCFVLAAVFLDKAYLKSARSMTPARLLLVPAAAVRAVFREDGAYAEKCAADLAHGYRRLVKEVNNLKLRSSMERLANWLLHHARRDEANGHFLIPFDKKTLAGKLGIAPEVLSRNFAALSAHGVKVSGKAVEVTDLALLESLAQPVPIMDDPGY
jgi:CRP/FNR family transcriptional regulator, transcriptional activator FtrB